MIAHRVSAADPTYNMAHLPIHQRSQQQVTTLRHQHVDMELDNMNFERFAPNLFEVEKVGFLLEEFGSEITAVEGMIQPTRFIGSGGSWYL